MREADEERQMVGLSQDRKKERDSRNKTNAERETDIQNEINVERMTMIARGSR